MIHVPVGLFGKQLEITSEIFQNDFFSGMIIEVPALGEIIFIIIGSSFTFCKIV